MELTKRCDEQAQREEEVADDGEARAVARSACLRRHQLLGEEGGGIKLMVSAGTKYTGDAGGLAVGYVDLYFQVPPVCSLALPIQP